MVKATDIVGYVFQADVYCSGSCVIEALPTGEGQAYDGWALAQGADPMTTEENLDEVAAAFGIERMAEHTFDSDDFPKVIFASQVEDDEHCAGCGGVLL